MSPSSPTSGGAELSRLLRTGPFGDALDAAIRARGLTLDRIRHHLAVQGVRVSEATLSYWRSGRSRPEREASLRAVQALEPLLGVPTASLLALLGPRRPRGRWLNRPDVDLEANLSKPVSEWLREQFGASDRWRYSLVSVHDLVTIRADRSHQSTRSRLVLRTERGRLGRCLVLHQADDPWNFPSELVDVRNCRHGQVRFHEETGLLVVELLLDRFVTDGDYAVIEYEFGTPSGPLAERYDRQFAGSVEQYCLHVQFAGNERPPITSYRRRTPFGPEHTRDTTWAGSVDSPCRVGTNIRGVAGVRWDWMDSSESLNDESGSRLFVEAGRG